MLTLIMDLYAELNAHKSNEEIFLENHMYLEADNESLLAHEVQCELRYWKKITPITFKFAHMLGKNRVKESVLIDINNYRMIDETTTYHTLTDRYS